MKTCKSCLQTLPSEAFAKNVKNGDGLYTYCRACAAARKPAYRDRQRDHDRAVEWYAANKSKVNAVCRDYHQKNRERRLEEFRQRTLRLPDAYIEKVLTQSGVPKNKITNELLEAKRMHIMLTRRLKEMR